MAGTRRPNDALSPPRRRNQSALLDFKNHGGGLPPTVPCCRNRQGKYSPKKMKKKKKSGSELSALSQEETRSVQGQRVPGFNDALMTAQSSKATTGHHPRSVECTKRAVTRLSAPDPPTHKYRTSISKFQRRKWCKRKKIVSPPKKKKKKSIRLRSS